MYGRLIILFSLLSLAVFAERSDEPDGSPVKSARAAELSLHKVEKLTIIRLKGSSQKILPKNFRLNIQRVTRLPLTSGEKAAFKFAIETCPDEAKKRGSVVVLMDQTGATLEKNDEVGKKAVVVEKPVGPQWPEDKDSADLAEEGLHFVIDKTGEKPELKPYLENFHSLELSQDTSGSEPLAKVEIRSETVKDILAVWIGYDGKYRTHKFFKPEP